MKFVDYLKIPFYWLFKILFWIFSLILKVLEYCGVGICWFANIIVNLTSKFWLFIGRLILKVLSLFSSLFDSLSQKLDSSPDTMNNMGDYE